MKKRTNKERMDIEIEMIHSFIYDMNLSQLEKMSNYACKLLNDKRYKNKQTK